MAYLELIHLRKTFGATVAVDRFDLSVEQGAFVSLLGPSGCGKTTTLRMIAGFEQPTAGQIAIAGEDMTNVPPNKRQLGMVFQSYALFPHMTVADNIAFGLKVQGAPAALIRERVQEMLALIQMQDYGRRHAHQLSGGQQQRVALARALAIQPRVLLLDEPLSALDARMRIELRSEIRRIQQALRITTIYVTHDQEEALSLSDRVVVMNLGRIEQIGTPMEIYNQPQTAFVAAFVGLVNTLRGTTTHDCQTVLVDGQAVRVSAPAQHKSAGASVAMHLRPENVLLQDAAAGYNHLRARVENITFLGSLVRVHLSVGGNPLISDVLNNARLSLPRVGDTLTIAFAPEACSIIA